VALCPDLRAFAIPALLAIRATFCSLVEINCNAWQVQMLREDRSARPNQARSHGRVGLESSVPQQFLRSPKFCCAQIKFYTLCFIHIMKENRALNFVVIR